MIFKFNKERRIVHVTSILTILTSMRLIVQHVVITTFVTIPISIIIKCIA